MLKMRLLTLVGLTALSAACASTAMSRERLAASQGSIRAAEEMGAEQVPQASLYLQYAREQAQEAQDLYKRGQSDRALHLLMRAEADAKLALSITRGEPVKAEANEAERKLKLFKAEHP